MYWRAGKEEGNLSWNDGTDRHDAPIRGEARGAESKLLHPQIPGQPPRTLTLVH